MYYTHIMYICTYISEQNINAHIAIIRSDGSELLYISLFIDFALYNF